MNSTDNIHYTCANGKQEGFYFESNSYKPCFPTCKYCSKSGDEINNNCDQCYPNQDLLEHNCVEYCDGYFFFNFDSNEYECLENCPEGYIYSKGKICNDNCESLELFINKCKVNEPNQETKDMLTNKIKDSLLNGELDDVIEDKIAGKNDNLFLQFPDIIYQITSSENQNIK